MLDIRELGSILESVGVRRDAYSLDGSLGDERLVLLRDGHHWVTFYSERGLRTDPRSFANEHEACEYFGRVLLADRTSRALPLGTPCALCGSPTRELWAIKRPRFLDVVKTGNWCKLARCCDCEALWCEVAYEPYGALAYLARWHFSEAEWAALHGRDDGKTVGDWNGAMVRAYWSTLPADELSEVAAHRKRSYGRNPVDEPNAFDLGELEKSLGRPG